jgi:L-lactate utilization protein LutB
MLQATSHAFKENASRALGDKELQRALKPVQTNFVQARARAAAKLLCAESRDIDKKEPVRDRRSRLGWFVDLNRFLDWRGFKFHNALGY